MNKTKRFLGLFLIVFMLLAFVPLQALANTTDEIAPVGSDAQATEVASATDETQVAMVNGTGYATLAEALEAAKALTGDVTVKIYDKVTLDSSISGSFDSITFVGEDTDAEIYLDVQGYITATGKKVAFKDLTLSKSEGGFITNAGFMNVAFGVYDVVSVDYTNCVFANGAYASSGNVTFTECKFYRSHDKYGLWAYGDTNAVVDNCVFNDYRGIKMYAEGAAKTADLTVKNTDFSAVTDKPAIVLTYGESVTLEGNTYSSTGTFELDLDGAPNGVAVTSDVAPTCKNDNGACGVLVDGKIYTTVAQAAAVAESGSTVTLLHASTETVELAEGVTLDKNGFEADGVTVAAPAVVLNAQTVAGTIKFEPVKGDTIGYVLGRLEVSSNLFPLAGGIKIVEIDVNSDVVETENVTIKYNTVIKGAGSVSGTLVVAEGAVLTIDAAVEIDNLTVVDANGNVIQGENGVYTPAKPVASVNGVEYATLEEAFAAAAEGDTIVLLGDATPALTSQRAITKASVIDLGGYTLTLTEDDLYFGTTTFKNGTIVVDPSVKPSTAVFWMFANQTLTFDGVKLVATGVTGTYLIGLDGNNSDLNIVNGSEIVVENTTALDLDIICVNASTGNDVVVDNSKVNVTNLDGRVFFRGNYTISGTSEIVLEGITKAGIRIEAGQTLSIEDTASVTITGEPRDGGIHITDATATYTKADTATVNATVNAPAVAQIGDVKYATLADALAAAKVGDEVVLLTDIVLTETVTVPAGASVTLDLNGKTISQSKECTASYEMISNKGNLTITGNGKISFTDTSAGDADFGWGSYTIRNEGTLVVENGTIEHNGAQAFATHMICAIFQYSGSTTINGGTISTPNYRSVRLWKGEMTINGGTFDGQVWVQAVDNSANLAVNGGTFEPNGKDASSVFVSNATYDVEFVVTDGTFNGKIGVSDADKLAGAVTGGTFSAAAKDGTNAALLATGLSFGEANEDGYYELEQGLVGSGTEEDPYLITSFDDLKLFRDLVNNGTYVNVYVVLTDNIDMEQEDWVSIGTSTYPFTGTFDGKGFTISNIWSYERGLFGYTSKGNYVDSGVNGRATIKNLTIEGIEVYNQTTSAVGGLVGQAGQNTEISNVIVTGYISIYGNGYVGGIVGQGYAHIDNCQVIGVDDEYDDQSTISANYWAVGGIIGHAGSEGGASITNCSVKNVMIYSRYYGAGSIAGVGTTGPIENVSAENVVIEAGSDPDANGFLVGCNYDKITGNSTAKNITMTVDDAVVSAPQDMVANVNGTYYISLQAAVDAANTGDTITILANVADEAVTVNKNVTITSDADNKVTLNNVSISGTLGVELTVSNLKFTGNSWINSNGAAKLVVSGVDADVEPVNTSATNSRSAFIALGSSEHTPLELVIENCTIIADGDRVNAVLGWAPITSATITGNTFGSEDFYYNNCDAIKFMGIADGAVFTIENNTIYGNYNGIVFGQNTTRGNSYTVNVDGNTFVGGADHIWIEVSGATTTYGKFNVTSNNTVNGNTFTASDIKTNVANFAYYAGVNVVLNENGEIIGGSFAKINEELIADGFELVENADGTYGVVEEIVYIAQIGEAKYSTIVEALNAAQNGNTIVLLADCALSEVVELRDIAITIEGDYTITLNDNLKVFGETTLNITSVVDGEVWLDDGAILKDSYINGSVFVGGNVTFRGENSVAMLYDFGVLTSNYGTAAEMKWTVEEGASLEIRNKARYGLGYGDSVTIYGSIEDALTARESLTEGDVAFFAHGLVAQESSGWNKDNYFTVKDAYVVIGSNNSFGNKPGSYGGNYSFVFNNVVLDSSRITFYEATSKTELSFTSCDVVTGTFMTRDADSKFTLVNTKLLSTTTTNGNDEGNYNDGALILVNSSLTYSAQLTNNGTITLDINSCLTAPKIIGNGTFVIDVTGLTEAKTVISADMSEFTGKIELVNGNAKYEIVENGVVVSMLLAGSGTESDPYQIASSADLETFAQMVNGGKTFKGEYVKLMNSVDLAPAVVLMSTSVSGNWEPIGTKDNPFMGTFDGSDYTVSNLVIEGENNVGFFGYVTEAHINNLKIENVTVVGSNCVGAVVGQGYASTYIDNCHVSGNIQITGNTNVGGIVGKYYARVTNSSVIGDGVATSFVKGVYVGADLEGDNVGGIMGHAGESNNHSGNTVMNIKVSGTRKVGGLIGTTDRATDLDNCTVDTVVVESTATADYVAANTATSTIGGLIGNYYGGSTGGTVTNCVVESIKFNLGNALSAGPIVGGNRTTPGEAPTGVTYSGNAIDLSTIQGATNYYLMVLAAEVNGVKYATLQEAINAAVEGDTITLLADIEQADGVIITDKNVTIDLNSYTFTVTEGASTNNRNFKINGSSVVTIKNGTMVAAGNYSSGAYGTVRTEGTAVVTLEELDLYNYRGNGLNIKACTGTTVYVTDTNIYSTYGGGIEAAGGTIELTNVTVEQKGMYTAPYNSMAISVNGGGKVTVNSGTYTTECLTAEEANNQGTSHGSWCVGVLNSGGTLVINGGTFANGNFGEDSLATYARGLILADTGAVVEINGGTFNALKSIVDIQNNLGDASKNPTGTIYGGTFSADPANDYVKIADGYGAIADLNGNYIVGKKPTATVNNLGSMVIPGGEYGVWNGSSYSGTSTENMPLSFVMQFLADQTAADMENSPYADWYADFVITFTGIENESFTANGCYLAGFYGDFGWVKVPVDGMTIQNGVRYPVMLGVGLGQKYDYVCSGVQNFKCALYLTPEILAANPNIQVNLELAVVDNSNGSDAACKALVDGETTYKVVDYNYDAEDFVVVAQVGNKLYASLQAAINAANAGDTITLLSDITVSSDFANAAKGLYNIAADDKITIDLNGKTINVTDNSTGNFIVFYNYGELTIKNGTVNVTSTINREWNAQSTIILNRGGILTIESGSYVHNGGTDMAITVDNSGNSYGDAYLYVNGGTIESTYVGIRLRMADPSLNGNPGNGLVYTEITGGEIYGGSRGIWAQITNATSDELGSLAITGGTIGGGNNSLRITTDGHDNIDVSISGDAVINGAILGEGSDFAITGGTFDTPVAAELCADGYIPCDNGDGTYGVKLGKYVATVNGVGYETVTEAIKAANDGDTVQLLAGTITETINPWGTDSTHASEKSITIVGADNFGTTLTGGLVLGYDDSGCRAHTITIKGIVFEGMGVVVAGQQTVVIEGNKFTDITAAPVSAGTANANAISVIGKNVNATVTGNVIDGAAVAGINLRDILNATVSGNTITNTQHNSITITTTSGSAGTVNVNGNNLSDWGLGGEGRAVRISGGNIVYVYDNVMTYEGDAPEEFVKVTNVITGMNLSQNYWNGKSPLEEGVFEANVAPSNYYADAEFTTLIKIAKWTEASLTFGSDLKMNFYLTASSLDSTASYVKIVKTHADGCTGAEEVIYIDVKDWFDATSKDGVALKKIVVEGIAAKEMNCTITAQIFAGTVPTDGAAEGTALSAEVGTSVVDYALYLIREYDGADAAAVKTFAVDMLNYGAAAQEYFHHYEDKHLANAELDEAEKALATPTVDENAVETIVYGKKAYADKVTVEMETSIYLNFYFNNLENLATDYDRSKITAVVSYTDHYDNDVVTTFTAADLVFSEDGGQVKVSVQTLAPADASLPVMCVLYYDQAAITAVSSSISAYCEWGMSEEDVLLNALCEKIMKYSQSAYKYFHTQTISDNT